MSTPDVPGAKASNNDVLAMGCWAEHEDGSLIFVEGIEGMSVIYSIFDVSVDPKLEYRDAMNEASFKKTYSWNPKSKKSDKWTWHDKTSFPWDRVLDDFKPGQRHVSVEAQQSAAQRVAFALRLKAEKVTRPTFAEQRPARTIMARLKDAVDALRD